MKIDSKEKKDLPLSRGFSPEFVESLNYLCLAAEVDYNPLKEDGLNTLKKLKPGYGYWVKVDNNAKWSFEENGHKYI